MQYKYILHNLFTYTKQVIYENKEGIVYEKWKDRNRMKYTYKI